MVEKACLNCHRLVKGNACPICKISDLTANWKGYVIVMNPEKSQIAGMLNIETPGKYALRLSK